MSTERWSPDDQLIASFLTGRRPPLELSPADRAWVVAGLTLAGKTAEDIAARLNCSLRLVRTIRADPMTQLCVFYQQESAAFGNELRLMRAEMITCAQNARALEAEVVRLRARLFQALGPPKFRCGHSTDRYNVYERKGKRYCRTCHRKHSAASSKRKAAAASAPIVDSCGDG